MSRETQALAKEWSEHPRWQGLERGYAAEDVMRLRGSVEIEHTLARRGAERLWKSLAEEPYVASLGALTGNQAMQMAKAGLKAIYLSGWQVAADANNAGSMYPDQSLYPADSAPEVVRRINCCLQRADQIHHAEGDDSIEPARIGWCAGRFKPARAGDRDSRVGDRAIDQIDNSNAKVAAGNHQGRVADHAVLPDLQNAAEKG